MFSKTLKIKDCMRISTRIRKLAGNICEFSGPVTVCTAALLTLFFAGCRSSERLPDSSSKAYAEFVSTFYVGLAALQVGDDVRAENNLGQATQMVPGEPAAWANWGILALRQRSFDAAGQRLDKAR